MIKPTTAKPELAVVSSSACENDSALHCEPSARLAVLGTNDYPGKDSDGAESQDRDGAEGIESRGDLR